MERTDYHWQSHPPAVSLYIYLTLSVYQFKYARLLHIYDYFENFVLLEHENELHNTYRYGNIITGSELTDIKELHFVELSKFRKEKPRQLMTRFEKWLYVLKYGVKYTNNPHNLPETLKAEEEIVMAIRKMREATKDDMVRALMESRQMMLHIEAERICEAEQRGRLEGRLEVARKMKDNGTDNEIIMKLTDLTCEEIEAL